MQTGRQGVILEVKISLMKRFIPVLFFCLLFTGCKKAVQNIQEDLVIKAMTNGQWIVTSFVLNGTTITGDFSAYKFQYHANRTVDAIKNGTVEKTGNWEGNAPAMTIWASFTNVSTPLSHLNGTWKIDRNSWTYVEATLTVGADVKTLRLDKL